MASAFTPALECLGLGLGLTCYPFYNLEQTFKSWKTGSTRKEIAGSERYDWRN